MPASKKAKSPSSPSPEGELDTSLAIATGASKGKLSLLPATIVIDPPDTNMATNYSASLRSNMASSSSSSSPSSACGLVLSADEKFEIEARMERKFEAMLENFTSTISSQIIGVKMAEQDQQDKLQATLEQSMNITTALMQEF